MEGNNVCKIYLVAAFAADLLAGGNHCFASFSDCLAADASFEADRHNHRSIFSFHQGLIHAPRQSPRWLKIRESDPKVVWLPHHVDYRVVTLKSCQ